ncbi:MAG: hypothetical protein EOS81_22435 [Mesorhizobium sp.]|nr:hypothetical protein EOA37_33125 [Mesorhizobium sp. M2A.F.Ca.ET.015.02.1.1]RVC80769.1 hypothetical protein EN745_11895 [Mesorhizobium sp. M4A.F.Ca.ET.022.05.2.1]RVC91069.1 hypothetical protein EN753_35675 [Mesorhizobium sp. M2A.F.Ca.ET.029.05.1.1]RWC83382.1 MAG: hypothetical protein EOS31_11735 [Mesorhizobium sp.]RWE91059.1 MAG: hypothetical protein EOS81_22435 [Mesorhizobium sp.]
MVFNVSDAAAILLHDLHRQTEKTERQRWTPVCRVLRGEAHPPAARKAFDAAALEAMIMRSD